MRSQDDFRVSDFNIVIGTASQAVTGDLVTVTGTVYGVQQLAFTPVERSVGDAKTLNFVGKQVTPSCGEDGTTVDMSSLDAGGGGGGPWNGHQLRWWNRIHHSVTLIQKQQCNLRICSLDTTDELGGSDILCRIRHSQQ